MDENKIFKSLETKKDFFFFFIKSLGMKTDF